MMIDAIEKLGSSAKAAGISRILVLTVTATVSLSGWFGTRMVDRFESSLSAQSSTIMAMGGAISSLSQEVGIMSSIMSNGKANRDRQVDEIARTNASEDEELKESYKRIQIIEKRVFCLEVGKRCPDAR